jgi:hypothetical protein
MPARSPPVSDEPGLVRKRFALCRPRQAETVVSIPCPPAWGFVPLLIGVSDSGKPSLHAPNDEHAQPAGPYPAKSALPYRAFVRQRREVLD